MGKQIVFATFLLSTCSVFGGNGFGQEAKKPFTKQEILRLLTPPPGTRYEQGNLGGEIVQRGIDFPADENGPSSPDSPSKATEEAQRDAPKIDVAKLPLLDQARNHAAEYMDDLPNFVVTQIVTRSVRTAQKKDWQQQDKLEIEVSYSAKTGEQFKLVRYNDKTTQMTYDQLKGATTAGEFGSILGALFSPESRAEFKEVRRETFHGHQTVIYDFMVRKEFSSNTITDGNSGRAVTTAYSGRVWIDTESGRTLRIEQSSDGIQPGFPITLAKRSVEYDWTIIDRQRYLLPVYAEVILGNDHKRYYLRNVIELRNYRMFDTDLKILPEK
jgi:hypothetical protein